MYKEIAVSEVPTQKGAFKFNLHHCSNANKYKLIIEDLTSCPYSHPVLYAESFISLLNINLDWPYSHRVVREYFPVQDLAKKCINRPELIQEWKGKTALFRRTDIEASSNWDLFCFGGVKKVFISDRLSIYSFSGNYSYCGQGECHTGFFADIDKTFIVNAYDLDILIDLLIEWYAGKDKDLDSTILQIVKESKNYTLTTFWHGF